MSTPRPILRSALLLALACSGCTSTPYLVEPKLAQVTVNVRWSTPEQIKALCGFDRLACATYGSDQLHYVAMWVVKPAGFDDHENVCALGHELLHNLGAEHRQ